MSGFEDIYTQYAKPVYRFLLKLTADADQAEELLQETFYQALLHIDRFEGKSSLYTWLCQIGKNAWLKECRRSKRFTDYNILRPTPGLTLEENAMEQEQAKLIRQAVYRLEEPYKEVFVLHVFGQLKLKEIAQSLGRSESWARVTYHRAKCRILQEVSL
ncbi:MAG: sigma-70 family RNA polymerase sigma factor [Oscillospiraceae bacterium]|nr:sigma-70 family RNA polymerase sigma factor [Oscillospiraceae bacterium]